MTLSWYSSLFRNKFAAPTKTLPSLSASYLLWMSAWLKYRTPSAISSTSYTGILWGFPDESTKRASLLWIAW